MIYYIVWLPSQATTESTALSISQGMINLILISFSINKQNLRKSWEHLVPSLLDTLHFSLGRQQLWLDTNVLFHLQTLFT